MIKKGAVELTEEQAFTMTRTSSREALERELDRLKNERVIHRWMPPCGGDGTYLIIWAPYEPEPGWWG
jgi:hypothetical protein